jgi:pSer/pThr/pTyr-binding forkhead associated (FHA) protein
MRPFAIDLNDRSVSFARDGRVLSSAPSAVWDGSSGDLPGANAWSGLRRQPTAASTRHLGSLLSQPVAADRTVALVAAELVRRLAEQAPTSEERIWMAVPARASTQGLSAMLAIARSLSLPVDGFVDSAVASVAALGLQRSAIVLEVGMHHAAATYLDRDGAQVRRRRTVMSERGGLMSFYQGWLELVSTTMVKRTRFDPLHDAATEQQLFDSLARWAHEASAQGSANAVLTKGAERFEVALTRDQFAQAAQSLHRELVRLLHELRPAGAPVTLVIPSVVGHLPGLRDELEQFVDCELVSLPDGFAARVISRLALPERTRDDPVRLLRRLPVLDEPLPEEPAPGEPSPEGQKNAAVTRDLLKNPRHGRSVSPSHLLLNGQVYALGAESIVIGRLPAGPRTIALSDGLAGVSRRHCTLGPEGDEIVLLDHSSFGTFVNGERVAERVRVHAGDRVRLGDPGVELALIAVDEAASGAS